MLCNNSKIWQNYLVTPGKTQLINHFEINSISDNGKEKRWYLLIFRARFRKVSQRSRRRWEQMDPKIIFERGEICSSFCIDRQQALSSEIYSEFISKLGEWEKVLCPGISKATKTSPRLLPRNVNSFMQTLSAKLGRTTPVFCKLCPY